MSRLALRSTQPPIQWVTGALSPRLKRPGREAKHSPPDMAEIKKMLIYISTPYTLSWLVLNYLSTGSTLLRNWINSLAQCIYMKGP
jgi:hypothetical protein